MEPPRLEAVHTASLTNRSHEASQQEECPKTFVSMKEVFEDQRRVVGQKHVKNSCKCGEKTCGAKTICLRVCFDHKTNVRESAKEQKALTCEAAIKNKKIKFDDICLCENALNDLNT